MTVSCGLSSSPEVSSLWSSKTPEDVHGNEDDEEDEVHKEEVPVDEVGVVRFPQVFDYVAERGEVGYEGSEWDHTEDRNIQQVWQSSLLLTIKCNELTICLSLCPAVWNIWNLWSNGKEPVDGFDLHHIESSRDLSAIVFFQFAPTNHHHRAISTETETGIYIDSHLIDFYIEKPILNKQSSRPFIGQIK